MSNKIISWYTHQRITIKGAIIGGLFTLFAASITLLANMIPDESVKTIMMITPTAENPNQLIQPPLHELPNLTCNNCEIYLAPDGSIQPNSDEVVLKLLSIQLWAEFDRPSVLVIYDILPPTIPLQLTLRIPAETGILNAIGEGVVNGNFLTNVNFSTETIGNWTFITFEATKPNIHFEYYDTALEKQNGRRLYTYLWAGDYAVESVQFTILQPKGATELFLFPSISDEQQHSNGHTYFVANTNAKPKNAILPLTMTYFKENDELTVTSTEVQPLP